MEAVHFVQFFKRLRRKKKILGLGQFLFFILRFSFLIFNFFIIHHYLLINPGRRRQK